MLRTAGHRYYLWTNDDASCRLQEWDQRVIKRAEMRILYLLFRKRPMSGLGTRDRATFSSSFYQELCGKLEVCSPEGSRFEGRTTSRVVVLRATWYGLSASCVRDFCAGPRLLNQGALMDVSSRVDGTLVQGLLLLKLVVLEPRGDGY